MPIRNISYLWGVNRVTICRLLKNILALVVNKYSETFKQLVGKDIVVKIDESKFGKIKYH